MLILRQTIKSISTVSFQHDRIDRKLREITTNSKSNSSIFITEIDTSHYALELISKMLECEQKDRISSSDVVIQLKSIKQKVIVLY